MPANRPHRSESAATPARGFAGIGGFLVDLALSVVLMTAFSLLGSALWAFAEGVNGVKPAQNASMSGAMIALSLLSTAASALIVYYFRRRATPAERASSWRSLWRISAWGWIAVAVLACLLFNAGIGVLAQRLQIVATPTNMILGDAIRSHPFALLIFAVLIAPAYEELLFRRVLFGRLWAAGRPWLGLALSSIAFALLHEVPGLSANPPAAMALLWLGYAFMSLCFGWVYYRSGSLWAAFAAHALNNLLAVLALLASA